MASNTCRKLTDAVLRLGYAHGFRNVGLDRLLAEVGISKTAFYKHFESKDHLVVAALEEQNERLQETFRAMLREQAGRAAADQLRALFDVVEQIADSEGFQGCIFVNVAMEFREPHDPAHRVAARSKQSIEELVFELAERAGAAAPGQLAKELCLIMEGVYAGRQVAADRDALATARRLAERAIRAHLEQGAAAAPES